MMIGRRRWQHGIAVNTLFMVETPPTGLGHEGKCLRSSSRWASCSHCHLGSVSQFKYVDNPPEVGKAPTLDELKERMAKIKAERKA
eukprot:1184704-Prorocentrum_minimum.AAC.3